MADIRQDLAPDTPIEVWFQDEMRVGQKNKLTYRWARKGSRPRAIHDQRTQSTYLFGAVCPELGTCAALMLAGSVSAGERRVTVGGGIGLPWCQAAVSLARDTGTGWVDFIKIFQHRPDRIMQAVQIESMKCDAIGWIERGIVLAQPIDKRADLVVSPHPRWKSREGRPLGRRIFKMPNVVIHARSRASRLRWRQGGNLALQSARA